MEQRVLVAYGTANGSTQEIAETVAEVLRTTGVTAEVLPARSVTDLDRYEAVVVGGALYAGRWHKDARRFVQRHRGALAHRPVWFFSSGPLDSTASRRDIPPVPGVKRAMVRLDARGHVTFGGCLTEGADPVLIDSTDAIVRVDAVTGPGRPFGATGGPGGCAQRSSPSRDTAVVVGAGPVGLAAIAMARLLAPERIVAVDVATARLDAARKAGADAVAAAQESPEQLVADLTEGLGADVAIEAVGVPETFEMCTRMVRPGGRVANVGVHGKPVTLHLEDLWIKNVTITTGLVDTHSTPTLLRMAAAGRLPPPGRSPTPSRSTACRRRTTSSPAPPTPAH